MNVSKEKDFKQMCRNGSRDKRLAGIIEVTSGMVSRSQPALPVLNPEC